MAMRLRMLRMMLPNRDVSDQPQGEVVGAARLHTCNIFGVDLHL